MFKNIFLVASCLFIVGINNITAQKNSVANKRIDPEFPEFKGVLLIHKNKRYITEKLKNRFNSSYKGKFQIVTEEELNTTYKETKTYPFIIYYTRVAVLSDGTDYQFEMKNRVTGKSYFSTKAASEFIPPHPLINKYIKALNKARGTDTTESEDD